MARRKKPIWIVLGWIALALAIVGVFLPLVPQVPFAIIAAFFFSKGSPRLHHWILNNKNFGAAVRDWELDHVIRKRLKATSIAMMVASAAFVFWKYHGENSELAIGIPIVFAMASIFVATRRSRTRGLMT